MAKIMKDVEQEQALLEVTELLQQLKVLDGSLKDADCSLCCSYRIGTGRKQKLPIAESYLISMVAAAKSDLQKRISSLCKKYHIELDGNEEKLMGAGTEDGVE